MGQIIDVAVLLDPGFRPGELPRRREETDLLLVAPDEFDVVDVRNPHMEGQIGQVDREAAREEWQGYREVLAKETTVHVLDPLPGQVDMVFCQSPALLGRTPDGGRVCVPARMRNEARRAEAAPLVEFFQGQGYRVSDCIPDGVHFEAADALWHPGRRMLWGGYGIRTDLDAYEPLAELFDVPVLRLELVDPRFHHLDTCFRPLDENTVLIYPEAFTEAGRQLISAVFPSVVPVAEGEASGSLALNSVCFPGRKMILQKGSAEVCAFLRQLGWSVREVRLGEFRKSGGSAHALVKFFESAA